MASYRRSSSLLRAGLSIGRAPWLPWLLLGLVTVVAYANAFHDVFVYDDREFLAEGRFSDLGFSELIALFSQSLWEASGNPVSLYRPLLMVSFGLQSHLFGSWATGYHLLNVVLHLLAAMLVFGLVREILHSTGRDRGEAAWPAAMATLIFAVHPVHTEVVNSVFNGSEIYMSLCVVGGLWYLLVRVQHRPIRAWSVLGVLYLCALLFRENAVVLPALAVLLLWMTGGDSWQRRLLRCLPVLLLLLPLAAYLALRVHALQPPPLLAGGSQPEVAAQVTPRELAVASPARTVILQAAPATGGSGSSRPTTAVAPGVSFDAARLAGAVSMWFDALRLMVWPHPLLVTRDGSTTPFPLALGVQLGLGLLAGYALYRKRPALATGLAWFYVAILPTSRIVSADIPVAVLMDRMLYLPSVGPVLCLAAGLGWLARGRGLRRAMVPVVVALVLLIPLTWARNHAWSDEVLLLETDFAVIPGNRQLLISQIRANSRAGNHSRAVELCGRFSADVRDLDILGRECARAYVSAHLYSRAEDLFEHVLARNSRDAWAHFELARLQARLGRRDEARAHFEAAVDNEQLPFLREFMTAVMLIDLYPDDRQRLIEAREHVRRALQLQPREHQARQLLDYLNQRL